ncbi:hypothetical protein SAMN05216184_104101 [Georgenia satyanarayanai]|uniref:Uncharacterized protein n=1 Tax=Georgenia satyanarayanai TaxID=860221 RepID=A0A2Y9BX84_9MICO|nr:hypothetical protein [Georgenia satyanarayanai]PYG00162.1 hypothetical protein A8987_104101 [Georgenia satyanarayanai]SSA40382.1 hypothetical protein SAMN05216184_104101 [Georgenia satyanarayanai]
MATSKVLVYRKDTGARVSVPEAWMEHPRLSKPFRKTPPSGGPTPKAPPVTGSATDRQEG